MAGVYLRKEKTGNISVFICALGNQQAAEDALQETFLKAYLHRKKYVEMQKEKAWLYQIARHTAYDMIRKRHKEFPIEKEQMADVIEKLFL